MTSAAVRMSRRRERLRAGRRVVFVELEANDLRRLGQLPDAPVSSIVSAVVRAIRGTFRASTDTTLQSLEPIFDEFPAKPPSAITAESFRASLEPQSSDQSGLSSGTPSAATPTPPRFDREADFGMIYGGRRKEFSQNGYRYSEAGDVLGQL